MSRVGRRAVVLLSIANALFAANLVALSPVVAQLAGSGGMSNTDTGLLFTAHFVGLIPCVLAGGAIAERVGKKRVLLWAMAAFTLGFLAFSVADAFWAQCLIMFVLGGAGGIVESLGAALASDLDPENPEAAVNRVQLFFAFGALISPLVVSVFISRFVFWKSYYLVLAAIAFALLLAMSRTPMEAPRADTPAFRLRDMARAFRNPAFTAMAICMLAYTGAEVGAWGWLSSMLQQNASFGMVQAGFSVAIFWAAMTLGRVLCGILIRFIRVERLVTGLAAFSAIVAVAAAFLKNDTLLVVSVVLLGLGCSSQFPLVAGYGSRLSGLPSGVAFAVLVVAGNVGSATVPLAMGVVGDLAGLDKSMLLPALLFVVVALIMGAHRRKPEEVPAA